MFGYLVYLVLGQAATLTFKGGAFVFVSAQGKKIEHLAQKSVLPVDRVAYRKDDLFVVWDARGLNIRKGKKLITTRLPEIAVTPKLFDRPEIIETKKLLEQSIRSKEAAELATSARIGDSVFLVPRWIGSDGKPWLEALVRIDMTSDNPKPQLLGRFAGWSAGSMIADVDQVGMICRMADGVWGFSTFIVKDSAFSSVPLGSNLVRYTAVGSNPKLILVVELTLHGTTTISRVDLSSGAKRQLFEGRGNVNWIDTKNPVIVRMNTAGLSRIRNIETGAMLEIDKKLDARLALRGLLVWSGGAKPTGATLYDLNRFEAIARWQGQVGNEKALP